MIFKLLRSGLIILDLAAGFYRVCIPYLFPTFQLRFPALPISIDEKKII